MSDKEVNQTIIKWIKSGTMPGGAASTGELAEQIEQIITRRVIEEMKLHRREWELFGDRPPYEGESVSLTILLAYHDDRIAELEQSLREDTNAKD